jgi:RNA polymerase sigma factor (sigma-70 family)
MEDTRKAPMLNKAQTETFTRNVRLAYFAARRFSGGIPYEDAVQIALLALARAIVAFDVNRGAKLPHFAVTCMRRSFGAVRAKDRRSIETSELADDVADRTALQDAEYIARETASRCARLTLTDRERQILTMRQDGRTLAEVGAAMRLSGERCRQVVLSISRKVDA